MASLTPPTNILTTYKSVIILSCKSMWYSFQAEVFNFGRSVQVPIHTGLACPTSQLCPYKLKSNTLWPDGQYLEQKLPTRIKRGRKYISQAADICTPVQMQGGLKGILSKVCRNAQSSQNSLYQSATSNSSFGLRDPLKHMIVDSNDSNDLLHNATVIGPPKITHLWFLIITFNKLNKPITWPENTCLELRTSNRCFSTVSSTRNTILAKITHIESG